MIEVENGLNQQKDEFSMKMDSLKQRRDELTRKESQLKESLLKFDKFLKVEMLLEIGICAHYYGRKTMSNGREP
jgi:hypothetical protein